MESFSWQGIDLQGKRHKGVLTARSPEDVKQQLFTKNIALLHCKQARKATRLFKVIKRRPSLVEQIEFFEHLAILLESGLTLDHSLQALSAQRSKENSNDLIESILTSIQAGKPFSIALMQVPLAYKQIALPLFQAGESTGSLTKALNQFSGYLKEQHAFTQSMRQATLLPLMTLSFTLVIMLVILLVVVPQFEQFTIFASEQLPRATRCVFGASAWLRSYAGGFAVSMITGLSCLLACARNTSLIAPFYQASISRLPMIGKLMALRDMRTFFATWALLSNGGVQVREALFLAMQTLSYPVQRQVSTPIMRALDQGFALDVALEQTGHTLFPKAFIRMIGSGQMSGTLPFMLSKAAVLAAKLLHDTTNRFIARSAPVLIIITGLIITLLMLAVYIPIFTLANRL